MPLPIALLSIVAGFAGLIWSADRFVLGASTAAHNLGVRPLIIGLTIVAFGTSAPEIFTSVAAAFKGAPALAVGNVLGSNIANIGLVLGFTALLFPLKIPLGLLRQELPALLLATGLCFFILADRQLDRVDGVLLLALLAWFAWRIVLAHLYSPALSAAEKEEVMEHVAPISTPRALGHMLLGLSLMIASSSILVDGARTVALALGVSELLVGLTVVAIGTSLPELATSLAGALRGHHDLAVGNIIGSNIMNLLLVLPVPALLSPLMLDSELLWRDYGAVALFTLLLAAAIVVQKRRGGDISRVLGAVLLLGYLAYTGLLYHGATA